jgi:hypothetical protein
MAVFTEVTWNADDEVTSEKMQQMAQNDVYLRDQITGFSSTTTTITTNYQAADTALAAEDTKRIRYTEGNGSFGTVYPLDGAFPNSNTTQIYIKGGTIQGTTNGAGDFSFNYGASAFPNGVVTAVVCPGAAVFGAYQFAMHDTGDNGQVSVRVCNANGTAAASTSVRFNFIAFGW